MIIISRTEMLNAADRCDDPDQADVWRRLAHECAAGPALADRIIGLLSVAVIVSVLAGWLA